MKKTIALSTLALLLASASAHAGAAISLVGVGTKADPQEVANSTQTYKSDFQFGGGLLVELSGGPIGLETGLLNYKRKFDVHLPGGVVSNFDQATYELPLLFRLNLGPISLGAGGYFAKYPKLSGNAAVDYGGLASASLHLPLLGPAQLLLDGRYHFGAKEFAHSFGKFKYKDLQILAGLRLSI